jgi:glycosyltransferase involved in cell wall biosynthesis
VRSKIEKDSFSYDMRFHGIERRIDNGAIRMIPRTLSLCPLISLLRKPTSIYWENLYAESVSRVVEKNNVDLIHAHFAYPEGLVGLLAKRKTKKPLIITVHGYDILIEPSVGYGVRLSRKIDAVIRMVLNQADAIIAASKETFNETCRIVNDADKVQLIPNGVDVERFNPDLDGSHIRKELGIEGGTVVFSLKGHEPQYGLEYLIRAASIVTEKKNDVLFVIGGDGSLRHYHEQLATKLGVKEKIMFIGRIPPTEVPYYDAMSDIVVVPSLQEAFGLVISEAMACGKPVIGTKVGGIPDQIIDSYNGFLVQPRDPKEIAEKILRLIENPEEAKRMGMNGRKIAEKKFDISKRIDRIVSLYVNLVAPS